MLTGTGDKWEPELEPGKSGNANGLHSSDRHPNRGKETEEDGNEAKKRQ